MEQVFEGFAIIGILIALGWYLGRRGTLGPQADMSLSLTRYYVATPALLIDVLLRTDVHLLFSSTLLVAAASSIIVASLYAVISRFFFRHDATETILGSLSSSYSNSANLGIPLVIAIVGNPAPIVPILLFQVMLYSPVVLSLLDMLADPTRGDSSIALRVRLRRHLTRPLKNPLVVAGGIGVIVSLLHVPIPAAFASPIHLLGQVAVPTALLAFGISLAKHGIGGRDVPLAELSVVSVLKLVVHPAVAWVIASPVLHLDQAATYGAVLVAALPTGQNVFTYAMRFQRGVPLARAAGAVTTALSAVTISVATLILSG